MPYPYADNAMNRLAESLAATNVLSDSYRKDIEWWALAAIGQAYHRGIADGRARAERAKPDERAALERWAEKSERQAEALRMAACLASGVESGAPASFVTACLTNFRQAESRVNG